MKSSPLCLCCFLAVFVSTTSAQFDYSEKQKDGILVNQIYTQFLDVDYLLNELDVTDEQKDALTNIVDEFVEAAAEYRRELIKIERQVLDYRLKEQEIDQALLDRREECIKKWKSRYVKFPSEIKAELIGNQYQAFRGLAVQRSILQITQSESFRMPSLVKKDIGLLNEEAARFESDLKKIGSEFEAMQAKARKKAWEKIGGEMPGSVWFAVEAAFGKDPLQYRYVSDAIDPAKPPENVFLEIENWKKWDFDLYEKKEFNGLFLSLHSDVQLKKLLDVTQKQSNGMLTLLAKNRDQPYPPQRMEMNRRLARLMANNDFEDAKRLQRAIDLDTADRNHRLARNIADAVLIPRQIKFLEKTARLRRLIRESFYGDDFGVLVAVAKSLDIPKSELNGFVNDLEAARESFYETVKEFRKKAENDVLQKLPMKSRKLFREKYGPFYDHKTEVISRWEKLRQKRG